MASSHFYDASSANCLSKYILQLLISVLLSSPCSCSLSPPGFCWLQQLLLDGCRRFGISGFCAVLHGRSHEAKSAVKRSKLKGFGSTLVPWKWNVLSHILFSWVAQCCLCLQVLPCKLRQTSGRPGSFHFCELQTQKKQEFWVAFHHIWPWIKNIFPE